MTFCVNPIASSLNSQHAQNLIFHPTPTHTQAFIVKHDLATGRLALITMVLGILLLLSLSLSLSLLSSICSQAIECDMMGFPTNACHCVG